MAVEASTGVVPEMGASAAVEAAGVVLEMGANTISSICVVLKQHAPVRGGHAGPWDHRGAYLPMTGCGLHGRLLVAAVVVVFLLLFAAAVLLAPHGLRLLPT
ncbi:hypothetical protein B0H14DRAFT_3498559 [Mycena olivaceomarginata]|nr:hypothetical protein B0H14DRAFT_3498559 [Mycena olivaceomarginata]